jgi:hypothetical protein
MMGKSYKDMGVFKVGWVRTVLVIVLVVTFLGIMIDAFWGGNS